VHQERCQAPAASPSPDKQVLKSSKHRYLKAYKVITYDADVRVASLKKIERSLHVKGSSLKTKYLPLSLSLLAALAAPAFAGVNVNSPNNGSQVSSPFTLSANASTCSSQNVAAMGYSLDGSTDTTIVRNNSVQANVGSGTGWHTVHVKAWGNQGAVCVTDVSVDVTAATTGPWIPGNAISVSGIHTLNSWQAVKDSATGSGWASGNTYLTGSPSVSGNTRQFVTSYSNYGGVRYHTSFGDDTESQNFVYDALVYVNGTAGQIGNIELDVNQTMPNGQTVIFGFQCDGYSSTWDYTWNAGSATSPVDKWAHSGAYCNMRDWSQNTWHHIQVSYSRDEWGNVTYHSVWLDGLEEPINRTAYSAFALGWAPTLLTNFQVDGLGAGGQPVVLLDNLTVYRW
jgi:hypothetical protein